MYVCITGDKCPGQKMAQTGNELELENIENPKLKKYTQIIKGMTTREPSKRTAIHKVVYQISNIRTGMSTLNNDVYIMVSFGDLNTVNLGYKRPARTGQICRLYPRSLISEYGIIHTSLVYDLHPSPTQYASEIDPFLNSIF